MLGNFWFKKEKPFLGLTGLGGGVGSNLVAGGDDKVYVEGVFNTDLWEGNATSRSITNDIDLNGEGGMVWIRNRDAIEYHSITDTAQTYDTTYNAYHRGHSNASYGYSIHTAGGISSFNSDGFSLNTDNAEWNASSNNYVSWTFRKAPGFFDIQTWNGDSGGINNDRLQLSHDLGCKVGFAIIKCTSHNSTNWLVWHKHDGLTQNYLTLNSGDGYKNGNYIFYGGQSSGYAINSSTQFGNIGPYDHGNETGKTYVAYLFADGDESDAQIFGAGGDEAIIKCGSYTGNGSSTGPTITLGFEPQWLMIKTTDTDAYDWAILDTTRDAGMGEMLVANTDAAETATTHVNLTSTGFDITSQGYIVNKSGDEYIYVAIRKPD